MAARTERLVVLDERRITVREGAATHVVAWQEVVYVHAARNGTRIVTNLSELNVRESIHRVVAKLAPLGMVRIHRGTAVNGARIRRLVGRSGHRLTLVLDERLEFDVGRRFQRPIRLRFGAR